MLESRQLSALVTGVLVLFALTGCGTGAADATPHPDQTVYDQFAECAREHGANVANPILNPDGSVEIPRGEGEFSSADALDAAFRACQPILSAAGFPPVGPIELTEEELEELKRQASAFATCMRVRDVPFPEPEWTGGAITNWDPQTLGIDVTDTDVQSAGEDCSAETGFDARLAHAVRD